MLRNRCYLIAALLLSVSEATRAQAVRADTAVASPNRNCSWSAATRSGQLLMGTWTAVLDTSGTVTGTWALVDARGATVAEGAWSAAKSPDRWTGAWRAVVSGRAGEYSGTWTANIDDKSRTRLADLVDRALQAVVSGTWRVNQRSGGWSIRTFK